MIRYLHDNHAHQRLGLIGTRQTVNSNVYKKKIDELNNAQNKIELISLATNLLASAIEEFGDCPVIDSLLNEYFSHPLLKNLDGLILGCTHYPVIKEKISAYFLNKIKIIDPSEHVAAAVKKCLTENNLLNNNLSNITSPTKKIFYISDYTESFASGTKKFFGEGIHLEHYPLWE
jgi:glutamate racemase